MLFYDSDTETLTSIPDIYREWANMNEDDKLANEISSFRAYLFNVLDAFYRNRNEMENHSFKPIELRHIYNKLKGMIA